MNTDTVIAACETHGAKYVYNSINQAMAGHKSYLQEIGLGEYKTLGDLYRMSTMVFDLLSQKEKVADHSEALLGILPKPKPQTNAQRQAAYKANKKTSGLVRFDRWVKPETHAKLTELANLPEPKAAE